MFLVLSLLGCSSSCPEHPIVWADWGYEDGHAWAAWSLANSTFWTGGTQCVAEVQVSPNAALGGETWRRDDGWTIAVLPDEAEWAVHRQICEILVVEKAPLVIAPDHLFEATADSTRTDVFVDACAKGPVPRAYIDTEVTACDAEPLTPEQDFLERRIFIGEPLLTAPDWLLEDGGSFEQVSEYDHEPTDVLLTELPTGGVLYARQDRSFPEDRDRWFVVHQDNLGALRRAELPLNGAHVLSLVADDDHLYVHGTTPTGLWGERRQWTIDRRSGRVTELFLDATFDTLHSWSRSPMVRGSDWTAVASYQGEWDGAILAVFDDGSETTLTLTPREPATSYGIQRLWIDPTTDDLIASVVHWDYVVSRSPTTSITWHSSEIVRIDVRTGSVEVLSSSTDETSLRAPDRQLQGVLPDGSFVYTVQASNGRWMVGRVDDGELTLAPNICVDQRDLSMVDGNLLVGEFTDDRWVSRWWHPAR